MVINFYANDFGIVLRSCARKNYENPSIFVKVIAKKSVAPFFLDTVYMHTLIAVEFKPRMLAIRMAIANVMVAQQ